MKSHGNFNIFHFRQHKWLGIHIQHGHITNFTVDYKHFDFGLDKKKI